MGSPYCENENINAIVEQDRGEGIPPGCGRRHRSGED